MAVYQVSYDLHKPGQNYAALEARIKKAGEWYHVLGSTWLVNTNTTAAGLYEFLRHVMDTNDRVFISRVGPDNSGWMDKAVWSWLNSRAAA